MLFLYYTKNCTNFSSGKMANIVTVSFNRYNASQVRNHRPETNLFSGLRSGGGRVAARAAEYFSLLFFFLFRTNKFEKKFNVIPCAVHDTEVLLCFLFKSYKIYIFKVYNICV